MGWEWDLCGKEIILQHGCIDEMKYVVVTHCQDCLYFPSVPNGTRVVNQIKWHHSAQNFASSSFVWIRTFVYPLRHFQILMGKKQ